MSDSLTQLSTICFPGETKNTHNQNLRHLLEAVAPLVAKGSIESVKAEVNRALALSIDDSKEFAQAHFWALHESWTYVHWSNPDRPIPPDRQRMRELYHELRDAGIYPFEDEHAAPTVMSPGAKG